MEKKEVIANTAQIGRQRNLFLALTIALAASNACLSLKVFTASERVVMVPGINETAWVTGKGVSESYLKRVTQDYLPLLLDLNYEDVDDKALRVMPIVSQSDPAYLAGMQKYFAEKKKEYKKYGLWTAFKAKEFEIDRKNLTVLVKGSLHDMFGAKGNAVTTGTSYFIAYEWVGGQLLIKEFKRVLREDELAEHSGDVQK